MRDKTNTLVIGLMVIVSVGTTSATELQPLEDIRKAAETFALNRASADQDRVIEVGHLDPRLRLPRCSQPLTTEQLGQQLNNPNITVTIKCDSPKPWSIHIPVRTSVFSTISTISRPLPRGATIQLSDLHMERRETSQLRNGYFENTDNIVGRVLKRSLPKGIAITPNDLEQNRIITRGSKVTIVARNNNITVKMPGKALEDATLGAIVKVENLSSKRIIEAIAARPGIVEVQM